MPINNLNNVHLTETQKREINTALDALDAALSSLDINLDPKERQIYGSVNEQHKLLINKVRDFKHNSDNLSDPDTDWKEFERDYSSRAFLEGAISRVASLKERLTNAKILHDYDNYRAALDDYAYTSYKAGANKPGYETKMNELKQFFSTKRKSDGTFPTQEAPAK